MLAFHRIMAVEMARTVYRLLLAILLFTSLNTALRIKAISSMNSVAFLPRLPVAEQMKGIKPPVCPGGRNFSYIRDFLSSSLEVAILQYYTEPPV